MRNRKQFPGGKGVTGVNRAETIALMGVIRVAYPRYFLGLDRDTLVHTVDLWAEMFSEDPAAEVTAAVKAFIATDDKGFPPHVGAIKSKLTKIRTSDFLSEQEAWNLVLRALGNSCYGYIEEYAKLPEAVKRIVGSARQLQTWAGMDFDTVNSVVASNFQRSYRAHIADLRETCSLPPDVRDMQRQIADAIFKTLPEA